LSAACSPRCWRFFICCIERHGHADGLRRDGRFVFVLQYGFKTIRPIFRERGKINAEVTGRLTESLGGVRVIKGYHAEEREARSFAAAWSGCWPT
jgi:hypothetical protein